jgi:hypothetical protein
MAVTVPVRDLANYTIQQQITAVAALISANANPSATPSHKRTLLQLQQQLVTSLMASGQLPAAAILAGLSYGQIDTNT